MDHLPYLGCCLSTWNFNATRAYERAHFGTVLLCQDESRLQSQAQTDTEIYQHISEWGGGVIMDMMVCLRVGCTMISPKKIWMIIVSRIEMARKSVWYPGIPGYPRFFSTFPEMSRKGARLNGRSQKKKLHRLLLDEALDAIFKLGTLHVQYLRPWIRGLCLVMAIYMASHGCYRSVVISVVAPN